MTSKKILRMGVQKTPIQKTENFNRFWFDKCWFFGLKKTVWLNRISLVFDKNDKHTTIYDSYNVELAAKYIKSVKLSNFTEIYSITNEKKIWYW